MTKIERERIKHAAGPQRPVVTFALKGFNQETTIGKALEAAFAQTYSPLEIVLSDDCSRDRTFAIMAEMVRGYGGPHKVVLNRNPRNLGIVGNMNRVAELASGRLMVEASGDDVSEPCRVERLVEAWQAGGGRIRAVHSSFTEIDDEDRYLGVAGPEPAIIDRPPGPAPLRIITSAANCVGATAAWDKELFDRFGPIPSNCQVEDGVLFFRAALLGGIAYVDEPLIRYRTGGISRRRPQSPGYDYLYGDRIKFARWRLSNVQSFLRDLEQVGLAQRAECERACREVIERFGFEVELADRSPLARLAFLPQAAAQTVRSRDRFFLLQSLKFALGNIYVAYFNARHGGGAVETTG